MRGASRDESECQGQEAGRDGAKTLAAASHDDGARTASTLSAAQLRACEVCLRANELIQSLPCGIARVLLEEDSIDGELDACCHGEKTRNVKGGKLESKWLRKTT